MNEPVPPMPGTYLALWIGVLVAIGLSRLLLGEAAIGVGFAIGVAIPFAAAGWVLARLTWPSYWRQKYRGK